MAWLLVLALELLVKELLEAALGWLLSALLCG